MKNIVIFALACAIAIGLFVCVNTQRDLNFAKSELALSGQHLSECTKIAKDRGRVTKELEAIVAALTKERDAIRAELKAAAEALGIEQSSESVELTVFREKLAEVEKRLERAKIDRDNLANELAEEKRDRNQLADAYAAQAEELRSLKSLISEEINNNLSLQADLRCCEEELSRRPNCCQCHIRYAVHSHTANPKKHRRHK